MKTLQRTLAIFAFAILFGQIIRHSFLLYVESQHSVLDQYDKPLKSKIENLNSLEDLEKQYDKIKKEVEKVTAEKKALNPLFNAADLWDVEPFKSESYLKNKIRDWEKSANEITKLQIGWTIGLIILIIGILIYLRSDRWIGMAFLIIGFLELIYWTIPNIAPDETTDLLQMKLLFSVISLVLLGILVRIITKFWRASQV